MSADPWDVAERAEALVEAGRNGDAIRMLETALAEHHDDPVLLESLAHAQLDIDPVAAAVTARRLVGVDPDASSGYLLGSFAALDNGDRQLAVQLALEATRRAPNLAAGHAQLAQALAVTPLSYARAEDAARKALELEPDSALSHIAAGNVALRRGSRNRAARYYRRALALDPTNGTARTNLAIVDRVRGDTASALGGVQRLLRLDPGDPSARRVLDSVILGALVDLQWLVCALALILFAIHFN